ncbi:uncharacterized protein LOC113316649 [Papaver somniferum]|uniref:uncharacterized protein LOC113316649 n=1 Tax=Papaver somniferum TaxID=3469 RepID=UPI000E7029DC|nr:uncharacterized protein LOC113316649 [Papaver somniferum]
MELIKGIPDESYQHLVGYSHMLGFRNKGIVTEIVTDSDDSFLYYFFAFGVCIEGFKNCFRYAFAVDGTHLTGPRQGVLLSAVGIDPDESIYPMDFAVVDSENNESWEWFMRKLDEVLGDKYAMNEDVVVAQQASTDRVAYQTVALYMYVSRQSYEVSLVMFDLAENIKQPTTPPRLRWHLQAAKAFSNDEYELAMRDLGLASPAALKSVVDLGPEMWARGVMSHEEWYEAIEEGRRLRKETAELGFPVTPLPPLGYLLHHTYNDLVKCVNSIRAENNALNRRLINRKKYSARQGTNM